MAERNRYSLIKGIAPERSKELIARAAGSLPGPPPRESKWSDWTYLRGTRSVEAVATSDTLTLFDDAWQLAVEIAKLANCPHLELRVQEGEHWDFTLFQNGAVVADFSTDVAYFNADPSAPRPWKAGNAELFAAAWKVPIDRVLPYLIDWGQQSQPTIAVPGDRFPTHDWCQVFDFLKTLGIDDPHSHPSRFEFEIPAWKGTHITQPLWRRMVRRMSVWIKGTYPDVPRLTRAEREQWKQRRVRIVRY